MRLKFADIRPGERRDALGTFVLLFGLLAGHSMLETARDALFLAKIPATRLPIAYVAIAILAIFVTNVRPRRAASSGGRIALGLALGGAAAITAGFWLLASRAGDWVL
jgi:ABC-type nitrate/sulfonate/bicarbonate transport system permease component